MLLLVPSSKAFGLRAALCTLLISTLNAGCNLEQFFEKKPKASAAPTVDTSLEWWSTNPLISPSAGVSLKGKVLGVVNVAGATVNLYSDSSCSSLVASGNSTEITTGIQFTATANGITSVYAKVVDTVTNTSSSCGYVGQYLSVAPTVSPLYASQGSNWNDYVINNGTTIFNATGAACVGTEANGYLSCLHGAEMKKVSVTGASSCDGLSITDSLDAFIWTCQVVSGTATFYSVALKPFKGLKDLIIGTSWQNMSVTITSSTGSISSPSSAWWSNTITALPDNSAPASGVVSLSSSGTVYTLANSRATEGYAITASKVALVTLSGSILSYTPGANNFNSTTALTTAPNIRAIVAMAAQSFVWIEANISGASSIDTQAGAPILARTSKHLRIKNSNIKNSTNKILDFNGVTKSAILDTKVTNSANAAIEIDNSSDIIVARVHVSNAYQGIYAFNSPKVYFSEITSIGVDGYSLEFDGSNLGTATAVSAINSAYVGIDLWESSNTTTHNALAINVASNAVGGGSATAITGNTWSQIAIGNSPVALGVSNSTSSKVTGNIVFAGNTTNCSATNSGSGFTNACANAGLGDATILEKVAASFQSSIVGKVYSDIQNSSDTSGAAASYPTAVNVGAFDFLSFTSWFRSWGLDGAVFPNTNHRGRFNNLSASGRIWDSRPYTNDTHIFNRTHALTAANTAITANAACPALLRGDVYLTDQQSRKYLKNAIEFVGDNRGNENGLCESNEVCVYTPNFGGYQGEGALFSNTCTFSDNGDSTNNVTGVTMHFYPTNGVVPTS